MHTIRYIKERLAALYRSARAGARPLGIGIVRGVRKPRYAIPLGLITLVAVGGVVQALVGDGAPPASLNERKVAVSLIRLGTDALNGASVLLSGEVESGAQATLSAERSGTIESVNAAIGDTVPRGSVIVALSRDEAEAAVAQARAGLTAALAQERRTAVNLENARRTLQDAIESAAVKIDDVLETKAAPLFTNREDLRGFGVSIIQAGAIYRIEAKDQAGNRAIANAVRTVTSSREALRRALGAADGTDATARAGVAEEALVAVRDLLALIGGEISRYDTEDTNEQAVYESFQNDISAGRAAIDAALSSLRAARSAAESAEVAEARSEVARARAALDAAEAQLEKSYIRAPFSGEITSITARVGESVSAGQALVSLVSRSSLEVSIQTSPDVARKISVGAPALVAGAYDGFVSAVASAINPSTGKVEATVALSDPDVPLIVGEFVAVLVFESEAESGAPNAVSLPLSAVRLSGDGASVFIVADGVAREVPVTIGALRGESVSIIGGLYGVGAVIENARSVSDGTPVTVPDAR